MPTATYTPIASTTLSSANSTVTFSSIPATYRDLILVMQMGTSGGGDYRIRFNSDTGSNYSFVHMVGTGSSAVSASFSQTYFFDYGTPTDLSNIMTFQVMDYSATDKHKSILGRRDWAGASTLAVAGRWANTSAVNNIQVYTSAGNFIVGSTFSLYGVIA